MRLRVLVSVLLFFSGLGAQVQEHQAAAGYRSTDAPGLLWVSGFNDDDSVQQLILDASLLTPMVGKTIKAMSFRRDVQGAQKMPGGAASFELQISTCPNTVRAPSNVLAANRGSNRLKVFSGVLQLPASPAYRGGSLWSAPNRVRVPFSTDFAYRGGDLCLEFTNASNGGYSSGSWVVDAVFSQESGTVLPVGDSAAPVTPIVGSTGVKETSGVSARDLLVGGTAQFYARGRPSANALFLIGVRFLPQPINLALVNSPQSNLLVEPVSTMVASFGALVDRRNPNLGGVARVELLLPSDQSFLGAVLVAQWLEYDLSVPSFLTSNAVRAQVAALLPSVQISLIRGVRDGRGKLPVTGKVNVGAGHVVKFEYR